MTRPSWDEYFMVIAHNAATRSTCRRRHVGAVIVKDNRQKGMGYNDTPSGMPNCSDHSDCIRGCNRTIHAELNAILEASPEERKNSTMYITDFPCWECAKIIVQVGVKRIVYCKDYYHMESKELFKKAGVTVLQLDCEKQHLGESHGSRD